MGFIELATVAGASLGLAKPLYPPVFKATVFSEDEFHSEALVQVVFVQSKIFFANHAFVAPCTDRLNCNSQHMQIQQFVSIAKLFSEMGHHRHRYGRTLRP